MIPHRQPLLHAGLLTLLYAALGWIGLSLVLLPQYGSPVFPAAGLALAFVLVHGWRMLPGVWLGALLMVLLDGWYRNALTPATLLFGIANASGASLQAALGSWLLGRAPRCGWRMLEDERDILCFMLRAGLTAGVVSASIGVVAMQSLGFVERHQALMSWWFWYSGDVLGILLFAPLSLGYLLDEDERWRKRRRSVMLPTLLVLLVVSFIYLAVWSWETSQPSGGRRWMVPAIGGIGLLFAAMLQLLLLGMTGHASQLQRKNAELQASEARYRHLFNESPLPAWLVERETGHFLMVNDRAIEHYGWPRRQWLSMRLQDILPDTGPAPDPLVDPTRPQQALQHRKRDGSLIDVRVNSSAAEYAGRPARLEIVRDVTAEMKAQERIGFLAYHDTLTGLPNRTLGHDRLQQALSSAQRSGHLLGILYLDIDNFKHVNDAHGHAAGDQLLQEVARRLNHCLRASDTLCRISGDEFMILLPDLSSDHQVAHVCERILGQFRTPLEIDDGVPVSSSLSIGVAVFPRDGADISTLLRHADLALYQAKRAGRNGYRFFEQQMNEELLSYLRTCDGLRDALARDELELHYQPQLALDGGKLLAVEALIRWNRPDQGQVDPAHFIEVAEESGLIVPIGRWVLLQACQQAARWSRSGMGDFTLAVNLSAAQFRRCQIEQDVADALTASGLDPSRLELELTESILLHADSEVLALMERWKASGIRLTIDDFGTGFSSLSYLKNMNLDKLKIDRSFVSNCLHNHKDRAIVKAMVEIARGLDMDTAAEGIEQPEVAQQLLALGCKAGQGYWYSRPLPAADFERWLEAQARQPA